MANMLDIAKACGVSRTVVSLVLNGRDHEVGISEKTRNHVLKTTKQLGYYRDEFATSMASKQSNVIAFVTEPMGDISYTGRIMNGIINSASSQGFSLMMHHLEDENHHEIFKKLIGWRACGVIFHVSRLEHIADITEELIDRNIPYATVNLSNPGGIGVTTDDFAGIHDIVGIMKKNGAKKPVLLLPDTDKSEYLEQRRLGFLSGMKEYYSESNPEIFDSFVSVLDIPGELPAELKRRQIDAVICISDFQAIIFQQKALVSGLRIPDDFLLSGFGGVSEPQLTIPALTTVVQDFEEMGRLATKMIINHDKAENIYLPITIREESSTTGNCSPSLLTN